MTLTKKVGILLILLTCSSLAAFGTFAFFFSGTASDGLFWVANNVKQVMLQEIFMQALLVRDGDAAARLRVVELADDLDGLAEAMQNGGVKTQAGTAPS